MQEHRIRIVFVGVQKIDVFHTVGSNDYSALRIWLFKMKKAPFRAWKITYLNHLILNWGFADVQNNMVLKHKHALLCNIRCFADVQNNMVLKPPVVLWCLLVSFAGVQKIDVFHTVGYNDYSVLRIWLFKMKKAPFRAWKLTYLNHLRLNWGFAGMRNNMVLKHMIGCTTVVFRFAGMRNNMVLKLHCWTIIGSVVLQVCRIDIFHTAGHNDTVRWEYDFLK